MNRRMALGLLAVALPILGSASSKANSLFWAINNFTQVNQIDGDTGTIVQQFAVPGLTGLGASLGVVGNAGYYTQLGDPNVYKFDITSHAFEGVAFSTPNNGYKNSLTVDANGNLWFGNGGSGSDNVLWQYDTAGNLLGSHAFPNDASAYRDGLVVVNGTVVANRGDQRGPYDKYNVPAGNGALTYIDQPFIVDPFSNIGNNGIAFNGVNYYVANEQVHVVRKYDIDGNYISSANLPSNSRYENWTFASQDIVTTPEAGSLLGVLGLTFAGMVAIRRK